ncbi:MAG TPA: hypothetical protein VF945_01700 [Polyangia bacterium]
MASPRARHLLAVASLAVAALAGCSAVANDPAADALMKLGGAQFYRGKPPAPTDGPTVTQLIPSPNLIRRGPNGNVTGSVPRESTAVAVWLEGDVGYWIVTPGSLDPMQLGQLNFGASASYARNLPAGSYTLRAEAGDARGHFGAPTDFALKTEDMPVAGTLVVSLAWDTEADLDLHLVTPDGTEVWANKINSAPLPVPGQPSDPNGWKSGGILDFDSNANCVIDGRRVENVYWTVAPPSGHYIARVDTFAMCGEPIANWRVGATLADQSLGAAFGVARDSDVILPHGAGAGVTALELDIP